MKIQLTTKEILTPLQNIIGVVEKKQTLPILSHVLIKAETNILTLSATDMELEIKSIQKISSSDKVNFTINAKDLINILRKIPSLDEIITFKIKNNNIEIKIKNNIFKLNSFNIKDFPELPKIENKEEISIEKNKLKKLIENTSFSIGNQNSRIYFNGLYFEINEKLFTVVASDGHRLAIGQYKNNSNLSKNKNIIFPRKSVLELEKLLNIDDKNENVNINISDNFFSLTLNKNITITSSLIDSKFPNYLQVIPKNLSNKIIINRLDLLTCLNQVSVFIENINKNVKLTFKDNDLTIFTHSERGQAKTNIKTKNSTKNIEIAFNINYLINILNKLQGDEIYFIIPGTNISCLLSEIDNDNFRYIVMPMTI